MYTVVILFLAQSISLTKIQLHYNKPTIFTQHFWCIHVTMLVVCTPCKMC